MNALTFNPWAALKREAEARPPAKAANPANPSVAEAPRLAALAGLAGAHPVERNPAALTAACDAREPALAGAYADADVREDREAIVADRWAGHPPEWTEPPTGQVERLARALARPRVGQRISDPEKAMTYFRGEARRRLAPLDPLARGLLVSAEEAEARLLQCNEGKSP